MKINKIRRISSADIDYRVIYAIDLVVANVERKVEVMVETTVLGEKSIKILSGIREEDKGELITLLTEIFKGGKLP